MSSPFTPIPPKIPGDGIFSALSVTKFFESLGLYTNETIDGIPLSVDSGGLIGITPTTVRTFPVGVTPAAIAITSDSKLGYVANNNNYVISGSDSVTVLDLDNGLPLTTITDPSFNQPYTITLDGTLAYVTNSAGTTITIIRTVENTVLGTITGFDGPSGMAIKDVTTAYVNNYGASGGAGSGGGTTVSIVDLTIPAITDTITVGLAPAAIALSTDQRYLYVALYNTGATNSGSVKIYDIQNSNTLVATIPNLSGPFAIAMNPVLSKAYVTNFGSNNFAPYGTTVSVIDTISMTLTNTISVGIQPAGCTVSPNGKYLYVTNYNTLYTQSYDAPVNSPGTGTVTLSSLVPGQGTVSIIDTETEEVISPTILVGQSPSCAVVSPDGLYLYISNYTSNTVSAIYINQ